MDWSLFWKLLLQKNGKAFEQGELETLSQSDCRSPAYTAFLHYVIAKDYAISPFLKKQYCSFPKDNELLQEALHKLNTEAPHDISTALVPTLYKLVVDFPNANFALFESEIKAENWSKVFADFFKNPAELRSLLLVLEKVKIGKIPYSSHIVDAKFKELYLPNVALDSDLLSWTYLFTLSSNVLVPKATLQESDFYWQNFFSAWEKRFKIEAIDNECRETCLETSLEILAFTRKLLPRFSNLSFRWQLLWNERMQRSFEATLRQKASAMSVLFQVKGVDASWLLMRLNSLYALNPETRAQVSTPWASEENLNALEQAMRYRVLAHTANDASQRMGFISKLCEIFQNQGAPLTSLDLNAPAETMLPGCYKLVLQGKNNSVVTDKLSLPFDSVLRTYGKNLEIKSNQIDAAFIDASEYNPMPELSQEAPPEDANALVLPLLVGLRVAGPQSASPDDIVFFPVHTVLREARGNLVSKQRPNQGNQGGNLKIQTSKLSTQFVPSFISFGSDGQKGAPAVPGGYGDESYLSVTRIDRSMMDWTGPQGEGVSFMPKVSHKELRDLWVKAKDSGALPLLQYSVDHTLSSLQDNQKNKLLRYCELQGYAKDTLEKCFLNALMPKAENIVRNLIDTYQSLGQNNINSFPAVLNGEKVYSLPAGAPGGSNPNGAIGERGTLWLEFN
jgi:hypothetical protein